MGDYPKSDSLIKHLLIIKKYIYIFKDTVYILNYNTFSLLPIMGSCKSNYHTIMYPFMIPVVPLFTLAGSRGIRFLWTLSKLFF